MAKKETAKKTKRTPTKKVTSKKVIEEVADSIQEAKVNEKEIEQFLEEVKDVKLEVLSEPVYEPTKEDFEKIINVDIMNGDPSVIIPSNDIESKKDVVKEIEEEAFNNTFKNIKKSNRIDRTFGYSWNGIEIDF